MLFENIYQAVWWDFSLKLMKMIRIMILNMVCVFFQGVCFYSYGLYLSDETLWDGIKSWDSEVCTSSGQDKVLGGGAIELLLTHTQGTQRWRWPHTALSGGQGTGEPSHNRRSLVYFPNYRDHHYHQVGGGVSVLNVNTHTFRLRIYKDAVLTKESEMNGLFS